MFESRAENKAIDGINEDNKKRIKNNLGIPVIQKSALYHRNVSEVSEVSETNRNKVFTIVLTTELEKKQLWEAIEKAMPDPEGKYNKGYFTFDELGVRLKISSDGWTFRKLDQVIQHLLEQRKLEEIEPEKFRPTTTIKVEKQRERERGRVSFKNDGGVTLNSEEINIQKYKIILINTVKNVLEVLVTAIVKQ